MTDKDTPIIIETEKAVYSEMSDREKQIYDEAYDRGWDDYKEQVKNRPFIIFILLIVLASAVCFLYSVIRLDLM